uniref:Putative transmembrane protein n=1 Tax=Serpentovirinae sp. TaxID=2661817 RepID=A0A5P9K6H0_9NIDO|nr:putative transmembrane protein [Serpentovirinae sp.]
MSTTWCNNILNVQVHQTGTKAKIQCLLILFLFLFINAQRVNDSLQVDVDHLTNACIRIPVIVTDRVNLVHELTIKLAGPKCKDNGLGVYQLDTYRYLNNTFEFLSSTQLPDGVNYGPRSCSMSVNSSYVFVICFHQPRKGDELIDFNKGNLTSCKATIFVYDVITWQLRKFDFPLKPGYCATSASQDSFVDCRHGKFLATSSYSSNRQNGRRGTYVYIFDQHMNMLTSNEVSTFYGEANIQSYGDCQFKVYIRSSGDNKSPYLQEVLMFYDGSSLVCVSNKSSTWHTPFNNGWVYTHPNVLKTYEAFGAANFPAFAPFDYGRYAGESVKFNNSYVGITTNYSNTNGRFVPLFVNKFNEKIKSEPIFGLSHIAYACGVYIKDTVLLLIETDACQNTGIYPCVKRVGIDLLNRPIKWVGKNQNQIDSIVGTVTASRQRVAPEPIFSTLAIVIINLCIVTLGLCVWVTTKLLLRTKKRPHRWLNRVKVLFKGRR